MSDKHKPWHDAHRQKSRDYKTDGKPAASQGGDKPRYSAKGRDRRLDSDQDDDREDGKPTAR